MSGLDARIKVYLEDARRFIEEASREFEEGVKANDAVKIRDSAEKAWNAVAQASNALILKFMGRVPASHWERRRLLRELEETHPRVGELGFRDRYSAREKNLHELVFYDGIIDVDDVRVELGKAKRYIDDVERLVESD